MIRVTHVLWLDEGPHHPPFSGAENHLWTLLPALQRAGLDVEILTILLRTGPIIEDRLKALAEQGVTVTRVTPNQGRSWRYLRRRTPQFIGELVPMFVQRRDRIIHLHLDFAVSPICAWLAKCPHVVMSIHNDDSWLSARWVRLWLQGLDLVIKYYIAISDRVCTYYAEMAGVNPAKISRIYYGVETKPSSFAPRSLRQIYSIPEERFVVGFVGRLTYQKNLPLLIRAFEYLPDVHGVIVGDGELRATLYDCAAHIPNIQFLGYHPNGAEIISCFDVFCLPSRFEGLGLVLVEAMLQHIPVIGSRAGAIPEILGGGQYGLLFDHDNVTELIQAIRFSQYHQQAVREMKDRAYHYACSTFSMQAMIEKTLAVYDKVLM
jgi:glycosyltransferase involved in cell wall biosynthesis